jgi:hypothetical protein
MRSVRLIAGMVVLAGLMTPIVLAQDKGKDSTRGKRAQLPANYSKLGLTAEQKTKILDIRDKASMKIAEIDKQIQEIRDHERKEYEAVLTDAQKARLREILASKAPSDDPKKK